MTLWEIKFLQAFSRVKMNVSEIAKAPVDFAIYNKKKLVFIDSDA